MHVHVQYMHVYMFVIRSIVHVYAVRVNVHVSVCIIFVWFYRLATVFWANEWIWDGRGCDYILYMYCGVHHQ